MKSMKVENPIVRGQEGEFDSMSNKSAQGDLTRDAEGEFMTGMPAGIPVREEEGSFDMGNARQKSGKFGRM